MNKKVIIIGASGHGKVIADIIRKSNDTVVGFLDDAFEFITQFYGSTILGKVDRYVEFKDCEFIIAIGNNEIRQRIAGQLKCEWYTAIDPSAKISESAKIGKGSCIMANAVVNADAAILEHTIINTSAIIEHDCLIGSFSHVSPRSVVCGLTKIGNNVWLGAGSTIINVLSICDNVVIGAGSVVTKSINEEGTYVGVPTKRIK